MDRRKAIIAEIPRLRRFARALVGDAAGADDLVQDCLERALVRLHLWRADSSMRAWLFTILRNLFLNQRRDLGRRPRESEFDEARLPAAAGAPAQGQALAIRDLDHALGALPEAQREAVLLIGLEGMSYKECANILAVPVGTVMSRLSRGRAALRRLMEDGVRDREPAPAPAPAPGGEPPLEPGGKPPLRPGGKPPLRRVK